MCRAAERVVTGAAFEDDVDTVRRVGADEIDDEGVVQVTAAHREGDIGVEHLPPQDGARPVVDQLQYLRSVDIGDPEGRIERGSGPGDITRVRRKELPERNRIAGHRGIVAKVDAACVDLLRQADVGAELRGWPLVRRILLPAEIKVEGLTGESAGDGNRLSDHRGRAGVDSGIVHDRRDGRDVGSQHGTRQHRAHRSREIGGKEQPGLEGLELELHAANGR